MSEKEFWTKYSRAEYLHSTKNIVAAAAEAAEDEELAVFLKQDDMLAFEARKKVCVLDDYCFHCFLLTSILKGLPSSVLVSLFPFSLPLIEDGWRSISRSLYSICILFRSEGWIQLWTWKQMKVMITCISRYINKTLLFNQLVR